VLDGKIKVLPPCWGEGGAEEKKNSHLGGFEIFPEGSVFSSIGFLFADPYICIVYCVYINIFLYIKTFGDTSLYISVCGAGNWWGAGWGMGRNTRIRIK
jgi:hypothetical protein